MTARILIVDDIASNAYVLTSRMESEYYDVRTAENGAQAIAMAVDWQPDLVLLDVMMPGIDGYETCRRLKSDARTTHIPVIMVTSLSAATDRLRGLECGADDFLTKPLEFDILLARVRSLIRLKRLLDEWRARGETGRSLGLAVDEPTVRVDGARALVVDDWDKGADAVVETLSLEGITATRARAEAEALSAAAAQPFDLVVVSLAMSVQDSLRLASRIRATDAMRDVPMLLIADRDQRQAVLRAFDLGASDWLLRPVDRNELRLRARNQIRRKFYQDRLRGDVDHAVHLALTDPLTGIYNRRYLCSHLEGLLAVEPRPHLAVMMIDLDHFKTINDRFGHEAGDRALVMVAALLRDRARAFDLVARFGGEEFVVIMPGVADSEAGSAADRLREAVGLLQFRPHGNAVVTLSASIGVAIAGETGGRVQDLLLEADQALYEAKRAGRNRVAMTPRHGDVTTTPADG